MEERLVAAWADRGGLAPLAETAAERARRLSGMLYGALVERGGGRGGRRACWGGVTRAARGRAVRFGERLTPGGYRATKWPRLSKRRCAVVWSAERCLGERGWTWRGSADYGWKRLRVIASEDVGLADSGGGAREDGCWYENWLRRAQPADKTRAPRPASSFHAVLVLVRAQKAALSTTPGWRSTRATGRRGASRSPITRSTCTPPRPPDRPREAALPRGGRDCSRTRRSRTRTRKKAGRPASSRRPAACGATPAEPWAARARRHLNGARIETSFGPMSP